MKILCDRMLLGLGHWLRVAGYDTHWAEADWSDREVVALAVREDRILLTCDQEIHDHRAAAGRRVVLSSNAIEDCAVELGRHADIEIDWLLAPLSRCLKCNVALVEGGPEHFDELPSGLVGFVTRVEFCGGCRRVYWAGSHADHMLERLRELERLCARGRSERLRGS